ncbi:MAG: homocysteine biosynthesis protein [Spirochaetaceae bacterium]|nr:homocysteine biosynthesis protein [Spirochaetaceae bacterium]
MSKSYDEINAKIAKGEAVVLTAEEVARMAAEASPAEIARKVDVVTTATFGAMCSSGCFINFGHTDPPLRMEAMTLNGISVFGGVAAVDGYIGATEVSPENPRYGGAHLIEALVRGEELLLHAQGKGTDCYPRREIRTWVDKSTVNEITMVNPRNAYQNYPAATNTGERIIYTYMGNLLPHCGNVTYSTSGELSPLLNDPHLRTIGIGTRVFLAGAQGFVSWRGTQFNTMKPRNARGVPESNAATLMLTADVKEMDAEFLRAAYFESYGVSLFLGIGLPVPILDEDMAAAVSISNRDILTSICDYGSDGHPAIAKVSYAELRSGSVELRGRKTRTAPLSSLAKARGIAELLKTQVSSGAFPLAPPVQALPARSAVRGLVQREERR